MSEGNNDPSRVCRHLLLSSPPGQFDLILNDLTKINPNPLTSDFIQNVRQEYAQRNHLNLTPSSDSKNNDLCLSLSSSLQTYMRSKYVSNSTNGVSISSSCEPDTTSSDILVIKIHVEKINLKNFHAGSWTSTYFYNRSQGSLQGYVNIHAHTFEHGNVQLQSKKNFDSVTITGEADAVMAQVSKWEDTLMIDLIDMYENMNDKLKSMRRILPLSRVKMDWNLRAHRMAKTLNERKNNYS